MDSTIVTFPKRSVEESAEIVAITEYEERKIVLTNKSPFHPVDHRWQDQPGDRGSLTLRKSNQMLEVSDCITVARLSDGDQFYHDREIPAKRSELGWRYYCGHVVDDVSDIQVGDSVGLTVDADYRMHLSAAHTSCHLVALALNAVLSRLWKKDVPLDSLGNPNFDQLAISESKIYEQRSIDTYRIGKSLKKRGFSAQEFWDFSPNIAFCINKQVAEWLTLASAVTIDVDNQTLDSTRTWKASLMGKVATIPCGGTHISNFYELKEVRSIVTTDQDAGLMTIETVCEIDWPQVGARKEEPRSITNFSY